MDDLQVLNAIADPVFMLDRGHRPVFVNDACCRLMGFPREELLKKTASDFLPKEEAEAFDRADDEVFATGEERLSEERFTDPQGIAHIVVLRKTLYRPRGQEERVLGLIRDITPLRATEAQLEQGGRFLDSIIENIPNMIFVKEAKELRFVRFNKAGEDLLGYSREELYGKNDYDFFPKSEADFFTAKDREVLDQRRLIEIPEETLKTRHQGERLLRTIKVPICDAQGVPTHLLGISEDITERRRAAKELGLSRQRFESLVDNLPAAVYRCALDPDWTVDFLSEEIERISGYPASDFIGSRVRTYASIIHPDDRALVERVVGEGVRSKKPYSIEYRVLHSSGGVRWLYERGRAFYGPQGKPLWLDGALCDITEQRVLGEALRESQSRLAAILENTMAVVYVKDLDGKYLMINRRFEDIFHLRREDILGKRDHDLFEPHVADAFRRNDLVVMQGGKPVEFEEEAPHHDGVRSYISVKVPLRDAEGRPYAMCGISTDITELKRAEEALRQKEAVENKSRFLSMVSHELRTPLQSMREGISVVLEGLLGPVSADQKESLSIAQRNVDRLTRLINDVLDMQRLDVHPLPLEKEPYDLNALVRETVKTMQPAAKKKGISLEVDLAGGLPRVSFEKDRMTQVLLNLINNAVKFTDKGGVRVATASSGGELCVSVQDTGIGIPEDAIGRIFESFGPVRSAAPDGSRNSGLGLAISKKIVQQLGGRIDVSSRAGKGSEFRVWLPLPAAR